MKGVVVLASALFVLASATGCRNYLLWPTPGVSAADQVQHGLSLDTLRLRPEVCSGIPLDPETGQLNAETVMAFLKAHGFEVSRSTARADLQFMDVPLNFKNRSVRLRVAVLPTATRAGEELHEGMVSQGTGSWGVHRGNVAVLGPVGHVDDIVAFAAKTRLACWGVLTIQSGDDSFVAQGGYLEF